MGQKSSQTIESDGGSSAYYLCKLPKGTYKIDEEGNVIFMLEEFGKYNLGNDFDKVNILKALLRMGVKAGNTIIYEKNKMHHYVDRL